jgi:hypothetical protein
VFFFKKQLLHQSKTQKIIMKKRILALAGLAVLLSFGSEAQAAESASAKASATIVSPISIAKHADGSSTFGDLAFGTISTSNSSGTVIITPAGTRNANGGATALTSTFGAAQFKLTGSNNANYSVGLPTSAITITDGSSHNMAVNEFTSNAGASLLNGEAIFQVGATLEVAANQAAGSYTGTFDVTAIYQ